MRDSIMYEKLKKLLCGGLFILLSVLLVVSLWDLIGNFLSRNWNNIWVCVGALSAPLSVFIYFLNNRREEKKRSLEKRNEENQKKIQIINEDIPRFWALYSKYELSKKEAGKPNELMRIDAVENGRSLLRNFVKYYQVDNLATDSEEWLNLNIVLSRMDLERDLLEDDPISLKAIDDFLGFKEDKLEIEQGKDNRTEIEQGKDDRTEIEQGKDDRTEIEQGKDDRTEIEQGKDDRTEIEQEEDGTIEAVKNYKKKNELLTSETILGNEVLIVRTVKTSYYSDFSGDWRINYDRARNIKYVIGVLGYVKTAKTYRGIIKVDGVEKIDDRVRFNGNELTPDSEDYREIQKRIQSILNVKEQLSMGELVEKLVENWNGINPTVYLSHLEAKMNDA
ncbi:hypothetical protein [Fructobacillus tropaeoli]|uniref:hypothetical protein n=1 Tax=Fructobacillus tropaeoli TaxID=709323 RepID=UPI002DACE60E|nr:unnamed protein product [Fructobacillus tropaeoli]